MPKLSSIRIQRFKKIIDAPIDLHGVNVLVGGNNSGKSSLIQGLHFAVGLLQTIALSGDWGQAGSTSLNPTQLVYSPSEDVYALAPGGKLLEEAEKSINFELYLDSGKSCAVGVRKGRNRNILVAIKNVAVARSLSSLKKPFSVFSPGLAGISKRETYVSDGVLFRTLARGDANLVLRNILLRLHSQPSWNPFLLDLRDVFPQLDIQIKFDEQTAEFIDVRIKTTKEWVPLEIAGTGVLQATQILSYIHRFEPSIIVLDEPDSHLHPNNQRLLCALLRKVVEERGIQILLTTHSRHVIDALSGTCQFLWVRDGKVDVADADDEIGILMDIGALDVKERAGQPDTKAIIITEDEITKPLETILESSGFVMSQTALLPYYGVTGIKQLKPLVHMIQKTNSRAKIVVHRDRDFLSDREVENWKIEVRKLAAEPFVTMDRDIESYLLNAAYLNEANPELSTAKFEAIIGKVIETLKLGTQSDYVNGRIDILRKAGESVNAGAISAEATKALTDNARHFAGKAVLSGLRGEYQNQFKKNLIIYRKSRHLEENVLHSVAQKAFRHGATQGS
jgi:energy-coupling factor transporter ATP-binding protein EcfA2